MLGPCATTLLLFATINQAFASDLRIARISKGFFNPSLGQDVAITLVVPAAGRLTALVVDRDGYAVRYISRDEQMAAGEHPLRWDGRDGNGAVVPDEAYSLKIDLASGKRHLTYFPAQRAPVAAQTIPVRSYDRRGGVIAYDLRVASRVHIQAGSAVTDAEGKPEGPVLKTVVDEQPRIAGSIIEQWNGFDESGTIYVPDQPHFVMSLVAAPLPENSIITVGNRAATFLDSVARRRGTSLIPAHAARARHAGLQTVDDVAPPLRLTLPNAAWSNAEKAWRGSQPVRIIADLQGPIAKRFAQHSETVLVFVDNKRVLTQASSLPRTALTLPPIAGPGAHIVAVNWVGRNGPVAVNAVRLINIPRIAARDEKKEGLP